MPIRPVTSVQVGERALVRPHDHHAARGVMRDLVGHAAQQVAAGRPSCPCSRPRSGPRRVRRPRPGSRRPGRRGAPRSPPARPPPRRAERRAVSTCSAASRRSPLDTEAAPETVSRWLSPSRKAATSRSCDTLVLAISTASCTARSARSEPSVPTRTELNTVSQDAWLQCGAARPYRRPAPRGRRAGCVHLGSRGTESPVSSEPLVLGVDVGGTKVAVGAVAGRRGRPTARSRPRRS